MVHEYAYFYEYIWKSVYCVLFSIVGLGLGLGLGLDLVSGWFVAVVVTVTMPCKPMHAKKPRKLLTIATV